MKIAWEVFGGFELDEHDMAVLVRDRVDLTDARAVARALDVDYLDAATLDVWLIP